MMDDQNYRERVRQLEGQINESLDRLMPLIEQHAGREADMQRRIARLERVLFGSTDDTEIAQCIQEVKEA